MLIAEEFLIKLFELIIKSVPKGVINLKNVRKIIFALFEKYFTELKNKNHTNGYFMDKLPHTKELFCDRLNPSKS